MAIPQSERKEDAPCLASEAWEKGTHPSRVTPAPQISRTGETTNQSEAPAPLRTQQCRPENPRLGPRSHKVRLGPTQVLARVKNQMRLCTLLGSKITHVTCARMGLLPVPSPQKQFPPAIRIERSAFLSRFLAPEMLFSHLGFSRLLKGFNHAKPVSLVFAARAQFPRA